MIYAKTADEVLAEHKRETRRIPKTEDHIWLERWPVSAYPLTTWGYCHNHEWAKQENIIRIDRRTSAGQYRKLYEVGQTYAICPGRGVKAVGRFELAWIKFEPLQSITAESCALETGWGDRCMDCDDLILLHHNDDGQGHEYHWWHDGEALYESEAISAFIDLWQSLYHGTPYDWHANPMIYALGIKNVVVF